LKILVAEDDVISCKALQNKLQDWGYDVLTAHNGEDAWTLFMTEDIRLAILDWKMPKMEGTELCKKIRQEYEEIKSRYVYVIMLTAKNLKADRIKGLSCGIDDYMTKPVSFVELKIRLKNGERIIQLEDNRIHLASLDGLTKLWNRNKILEFLEEELDRGRRCGQPTGIIMVDIDYFKQINDTYGHFTGDKVLAEVADRLKREIRRYDKIGRYGGDEMFFVLPNCRQAHLQKIANRLRCCICNKAIPTKSGPLKVSISLGAISSEISSKAPSSDLIQASDRALYAAKKLGRNRLVISSTISKFCPFPLTQREKPA